MSIGKEQVCILIPTLNEAPTIGTLIHDFNNLGFYNILVIDGIALTDTTNRCDAGARVILQRGKGKGTAIIEAFSLIDQPFILMIDGDGTYLPQDAEQMLNRLSSGADQVIRRPSDRREPGFFFDAELHREPDTEPPLQDCPWELSVMISFQDIGAFTIESITSAPS